MYPIKVDRHHTLHVRRNGTIAAITVDGIKQKCAGKPVILDATRLRGTVLRVECAEREAAQREFDARFEAAAFADQFIDAVLEVKERSNGKPCGDEIEGLLCVAAVAIDPEFETESEGERA